MSERIFYVLGTAGQVPTRKRNHNGYFLRLGQHGFLFDPGEGTQRQMIFSSVTARTISKIFITHFHGDHCLGLPGVLQRLSLDKAEHPVDVYFPASGEQYFENLKNASIYYNAATIRPVLIDTPGIIYQDEELTISSEKLDHTVDSWGYRIKEADSYTLDKTKLDKMGLHGQVVGELKNKGEIIINDRKITLAEIATRKKGFCFAFIMDTRLCDAAIRLAHKADVVVAESTYMQQHQKEAGSHGHMTTIDAAHLACQAQAQSLILTHFSQRYGEDADFVSEAKSIFNRVIAVNDGDNIDLRRFGWMEK